MSEYGIFYGATVMSEGGKHEPLIESMLWERDTVFLIGKEKVGKSILGLQMACCLTTAEPLFDTYQVYKESEVLYIQTEGKRWETQDRLRRMNHGITCNYSRFTHIFQPGLVLDTEGGYSSMRNMLNQHKRRPDVIFIDPLYMTLKGDLKEPTCCKLFMENIRRLTEEYDSTIIIIHHTHREKRSRDGDVITEGDKAIYGSFAWSAYADHVFLLRKKDKHYSLTCDTQRSANIVDKIEFKLLNDPLLFTIEVDTCGGAVKVHKLLQDTPDGLTMKELQEQIPDLTKRSLYSTLRYLLNNKIVYKKGHGYPVKYYFNKE